MPFPYATRDQLEAELPYGIADHPTVDTESQWDALLERLLKQESERVEGAAFAGQDWRDEDVPEVVRGAVIRLVRQTLAGVTEDGLNSEATAAGAQYNYRPPQAIRNEVRESLRSAGYGDSRYVSSTD